MASHTTSETSALRFADFETLSERMLAPIEGYEKMPVVSLEEAVKPLLDIVPKVERNVFIVKENCQEPKDGLTSDESASIMLYTFESEPHADSLYVILNATLRSEQRQGLKPWFLYLRLVLNALARLPSEPRFLHRGVRGDLQAQYPTGKSIIWWGFSSCTSSIGVLGCEHFFGKTGTRTLFQIECSTGKDIKNHSFLQREDEILLLPARKLMVTSCLDSGNGLHIIQLKETEPKYPLLEPVPLANPIPTLRPPIAISSIQPMIGPNLSVTARWAQNGVTVAGGNGRGDSTNQLSCPRGLSVDEEDTVIVADWGNHRIMEWKQNATSALVLAGGNGAGKRLDQLDFPMFVLVDKATDSLIISDWGNQRVTRWPRQTGKRSGETMIDNIACFGFAMDDEGSLYVTYYEQNEVRCYQRGETNGMVVAGGNEKGAGPHQLNTPARVCVDEDRAVYVSDNWNHRVLQWGKNAKQGITVAGGRGEGCDRSQLFDPRGVLVDAAGTVYVADCGNHRVMRWCRGATQGIIVVGGNGKGEGANQFSSPMDLSFDRWGNLYVSDLDNNRVQRFSIENS